MEENKNERDEHTEELPMVEDVVWHHEDEEDSLNEPIQNEVHMTPIEADEPKKEEPVKKEVKKEQPKKQVPPKKKNQSGIKILVVILIVCVLGAGGWYLISQYQKDQAARQAAHDKVYQQLKVTFKEDEKDADGNKVDLTIYEYGEEANDPLDLVDTHYGDISCNPSTIDTSKVGTVKLTYTVSMEDSYDELVTREFSINVTIHDTQSPKIEAKESSITITEGDAFDPNENITSVKDVVDGDLEYVEKAPEKNGESAPFYETGWYTLDSNVDTETPGSYNVRIKACDINGNSTDASYSVTVKQKDPTSFMAIATKKYTKVLGTLDDGEEQGSGEIGEWTDVDGYLGDVLYKSDQYTSQDEMQSAAENYASSNFDDLTKDKASTQIGVGDTKITVEAKEATVYYMEALDDEGNVMYYFFAIV